MEYCDSPQCHRLATRPYVYPQLELQLVSMCHILVRLMAGAWQAKRLGLSTCFGDAPWQNEEHIKICNDNAGTN